MDREQMLELLESVVAEFHSSKESQRESPPGLAEYSLGFCPSSGPGDSIVGANVGKVSRFNKV